MKIKKSGMCDIRELMMVLHYIVGASAADDAQDMQDQAVTGATGVGVIHLCAHAPLVMKHFFDEPGDPICVCNLASWFVVHLLSRGLLTRQLLLLLPPPVLIFLI